jgi:Phage tail sheath protein subtilisin-like domain/Phage tail sheath protein beta-sandwich domain
MPGIFSKASRPVLAGTYFNFLVSQPPVVSPSAGQTVAVCFTHTWGPLEEATLCNSFSDFLEKFGGDPLSPSPGYVAVKEAFLGEASVDFGGAGAVLAYRMGGTGAAKATTAIGTLTLTAKYEGTSGNALRVTAQDDPTPTNNQLVILDNNGVVLETYVYLDTDIPGLAAQINAASRYVTAVGTGSTALTPVVAQAMTGGNDGATLVAQDYTDTMTALEVQRFGALVFENLTDSAIQASLKTWAANQQKVGRRFFTVVGGALDETITTAVSRSVSMNHEDIINVGVGSVRDNDTVDVNGNPVVLSSAQLAPRIAGVVANRGVRMALTFAKLPGLELVKGADAAGIVTAYDNGVVVLSRASDAAATVRIEKGLTTYLTKTNTAKPKAIYSNPKFVAVMHGLQQDLGLWADENIIGRTTVDDDTRASVLAHVNELLRQYQLIGAVQPGWGASVDPIPPPSDDDSFVAFLIACKFGRSTEQVYFSIQAG